MRNIAKLRDGFLVVASALYALGYLVWSIYAIENNLGLLPALEPQYFLAGVVPGLVLLLGYWVYRFWTRIREILQSFADSKKEGWRRALIRTLRGGFVLSIIAFIISSRDWFQEAVGPTTAESVTFTATCLFLFTFCLIPHRVRRADRNLSDKFFDVYRSFYFVLCVCSLCLGLLAACVLFVHPNLPQELGGAKPRNAFLYFAVGDLPEDLADKLLPKEAKASDYPVVKSKKLPILFASGNYILLRLGQQGDTAAHPQPAGEGEAVAGAQEGQEKKSADNSVLELRRDVVKAIQWCDD